MEEQTLITDNYYAFTLEGAIMEAVTPTNGGGVREWFELFPARYEEETLTPRQFYDWINDNFPDFLRLHFNDCPITQKGNVWLLHGSPLTPQPTQSNLFVLTELTHAWQQGQTLSGQNIGTAIKDLERRYRPRAGDPLSRTRQHERLVRAIRKPGVRGCGGYSLMPIRPNPGY